MNRWINPSHPQTLQAAVFLGYFSAVFGILFTPIGPLFLLYIGVGVGAFGSANNKRWGYFLLAVCAVLIALLNILGIAFAVPNGVVRTLLALNASVFPAALAVAVVHAHSREYQRVWFE
ncbi:MAG: hypothetical protein AAF962_12535 [Actinomycetota bacterium]